MKIFERQIGKLNKLLVVLTMLAVFSIAWFVVPQVIATELPQLDVTLYSGDSMPAGRPESDTEMLFTTYLGEPRNPHDTITLATQIGEPFVIAQDAVQLGTDTEPFDGTVKFNDASANTFDAQKALFAYVSTDASFMTSNGAPYTGTMTFDRSGVYDSPLFAEHVTAGTATASWNIRITSSDDDLANYSGVIGEIGDGAKVALTFTDNAGAKTTISANGHIGIACGAMGEGAELAFTFIPTGGRVYSVKTASGAAGGIVGKMGAGAKLTLLSDITNRIDVTVDGSLDLAAPAMRTMMMAPKVRLATGPALKLSPDSASLTTSGAAVKTSGPAIETSGSAITTSGAAIETSGSAITTSGPAIETSGPAITTSGAAIDMPGTGDQQTSPAAAEPAEQPSAPSGDTQEQGQNAPAEPQAPTQEPSEEAPAQEQPAAQDEQGAGTPDAVSGQDDPDEQDADAASGAQDASSGTGAVGALLSDFHPASLRPYGIPQADQESGSSDDPDAGTGGAPAAQEAPAGQDEEEPAAQDQETPPAQDEEDPAAQDQEAPAAQGPADPPDASADTSSQPAITNDTTSQPATPAETTTQAAVTTAPAIAAETTPAAVTTAAITPAAITPAAITPAAITPAAVTPAAVSPATPASVKTATPAAVTPAAAVKESPAAVTLQAFKAPLRLTARAADPADGYAGGLVGWAQDAEIIFGTQQDPTTASITGTITGTNGAGGIYGYYKSTTSSSGAGPRTFDFSSCTVDAVFEGGTYTGGLFGTLEAENSVTIDENFAPAAGNAGVFHVSSSASSGTYSAIGGLIGYYSNTDLSNALLIQNTKASVSVSAGASPGRGGFIGQVCDSPVYIKFSNVGMSGSTLDGGLIGDLGTGGSFVDVADYVGLAGTTNGGGLIGYMHAGVLRLAGQTRLSDDAVMGGSLATGAYGQLVGGRGDSLIYALGSGEDAVPGWAFYRSPSNRRGDIYDWGEVLRLSSASGLSESDLFTVDMAAHTVTVKAAVASNIKDRVDFAKTALNIQLNYGSGLGALQFAGSPTSQTLLAGTISLKSGVSIDLADTGLTGFTRDNYNDTTETDLGRLSGTFDGNGSTITMASGEFYGLDASGAVISSEGAYANIYRGNGIIYSHRYVGLFAKSASGARMQDLVLRGSISTYVPGRFDGDRYTWCIGALIGQAAGSLTLDDMDVSVAMTTAVDNSNGPAASVGGAVGLVTSAAGTINVNGGTYASSFTDIRNNSDNRSYTGGIIGKIDDSTSLRTVNIDGVRLAGSYSNASSPNHSYSRFGGMIGMTAQNSSTSNYNLSTQINITSSDIGALTIDASTYDAAGGLLGYSWFNAGVEINGLTIDGARITALSSGRSGRMAGLVTIATGRMAVTGSGITVADAEMVTQRSGSSFGFLVNSAAAKNVAINDGYEDRNANSALLLEINGTYDLSGLTMTESGGTFTVFDEICAYTQTLRGTYANGVSTHTHTDPITANGAAIVSIETAGSQKLFAGGTVNTYQNQTAFGKSSGHEGNINSRYYYNLTSLRQKAVSGGSLSAAEKALLWSLNVYGHASLAQYFPGGYNGALSGNMDFTGLSYYPVTANASVTGTIRFDNKAINDGEESAGGGSDGYARRTDESTQHYLMHTGLLYDSLGLNVTGLTLQGNSGLVPGTASGYLIAHGIGGSSTDLADAQISQITLDGARINGASAAGSVYAPLLINTVHFNTSLSLSSVTSSALGYSGFGAGDYAGSSLIGTVGTSTATGITLSFSQLGLDARTAALVNGTANAQLSAAYHTNRSLFYRATILDSFSFNTACQAVYDYSLPEDWSASTPRHYVTYGREVSESLEYPGDESKYKPDAGVFTSPESHEAASPYDFSSGWLPYVYRAYDGGAGLHEISVNYLSVSMKSGCGQYNDPYIISNGSELSSIERVIRGDTTLETSFTLILPEDIGTGGLDMWHDGGAADIEYRFNGTDFEYYDQANSRTVTVSFSVVREYLAGAYYLITKSINLPASGWDGLGYAQAGSVTSNIYEYAYAFRGVIVGKNLGTEGSPVYPTITLNSNTPFIQSANGAVVKNVNFHLNANVTLSEPNQNTYKYSDGNSSYGVVIAQVMGGDNIIDRVGLDFTGASFSYDSSAYRRLIPVGGYAGIVFNGGLIFRNMDGVAHTGLTSSVFANVADDGWLYVNPIIGRVAAGYAFTESASYAGDEDGATMKNGLKNYSIPDLHPSSASKLTVTATASKTYEITAPDPQSLFVLSSIINSGAASANYSASAVNAYTSISGQPWIAYRNYTSTRNAQYDEVTTGALKSGDFALAASDLHSVSAKVPYIVRVYTSQDAKGLYQVRSICGDGESSIINRITLSAGTYVMPTGFRGLGSFFTTSSYLAVRFRSLEGSNANIVLNMRYHEYHPRAENIKAFDNAGFGLFNSTHQKNADNEANAIRNFTLSGTVDYRLHKLSNGSLTGYKKNQNANDEDGVNYNSVMEVGGIVGRTTETIRIQNVTLSGITVNGIRESGGMIGYFAGGKKASNKLFIIDCGTDSEPITVTSGFRVGGLIGSADGVSGGVNIIGNENAPKTFALKSIEFRNTTEVTNAASYSAGGLIGVAWQTGTSANESSFNVKLSHLRVKGTPGYLTVGADLNNANRQDDQGGLIGIIRAGNDVQITDCVITDVTVIGGNAGAITGQQNDSGKLYMDDVHVRVTGGNDGYAHAYGNAGALVGKFDQTNSGRAIMVKVSNCSVQGFEAASLSSTSNNTQTAGLIAGYFNQSRDKSSTIFVNNFHADESTVFTSYSGSSNNRGTGFLLGLASGNKQNLYGYDILLDDCTLAHYAGSGGSLAMNLDNIGLILGNNRTGAVIQLAGVSAYGSTITDRLAGKYGGSASTEWLGGADGSEGIVAFADYKGYAEGSGGSKNTADSVLHGGSDIAAAKPYVTVNGYTTIGQGQLITSDGFASGIASSPIKAITDEGGSRYKVSSGYLSTFDFGLMAMFSSEIPAAQSIDGFRDFPVLVLDETRPAVAGELINSYINLLANTNINYADDAAISGKCSVDLYRMQMDNNGVFAKQNDSSLLHDTVNNRFYMTTAAVDNNRRSFTMIDVGFFDPDTGNVAYHLYVPVMVKKVMMFNFSARVLSGTTYEPTPYLNSRSALENFGIPITTLFDFDYDRTAQEWTDSLGYGESFMGRVTKTLKLAKEDNVNISHLPGGTKMALVDIQTGNAYYATFSAVYNSTTGVLDLSAFEDAERNAFEPVPLSDLLSTTLTSSASGKYVECYEGDAQIKIGDDHYRLYTDADSGSPRYDITVTAAARESYYLSFFTDPESSGIARYTIRSQTSLAGDYPTLLGTESNAEMIIGQVYEISDVAISTEGGEFGIISRQHDTIEAELSAQIVMHNAGTYSAYAGSMYHSFLLHMTRTNDDGSSRTVIEGDPTVRGTYTINSGPARSYTNGAGTSWTAGGGFIQFTAGDDLRSALSTGAPVTIAASVSVTYGNQAAIDAQFPARPADILTDLTTGTKLFVKSNIAAIAERTAYSSISERADDTDRYFSGIESRKANLSYNTADSEMQGDLGQLGVNPLDNDDSTVQLIETVGVLDYSQVELQAEGYTHLRVTLQLEQKNDGYHPVAMADFLSYLKVGGADVIGSADGVSVTLYLPRNNIGCIETVFVDLGAKTGAALSNSHLMYSNYKVLLDVDLVKYENSEYTMLVDSDPDYIIYTNAKLLPDFIG